MSSLRRATAAPLIIAALLLAPSLALGASAPFLNQTALAAHPKATCQHTGVTGPTGKVVGLAYALKGAHPAKATLTCARVSAVLKAGKRDMFAKLHSSNGKKLTVRGTTYTVREFIALGASGPTPAFVGDGSAIVAEYATGR
jgi:hypothetical protein